MTRDWISAHLFHRGGIDQLIVGAVAPLIDELKQAAAIEGFFFLRYWEGGPHLRLRLLPAAPSHADETRAALLGHCGRYLAENPSPPAPPNYTAAYRAMAGRLAAAERLANHDQRLYPDDTIQWIPYCPEHASYGQRPALSAVENHFTDSSDIALKLITADTPASQRRAMALAMLMLVVAVCEPDPASVGTRLRDLAAACPARVGAVTTIEDTYRPLRQALRSQARDLSARADRPDALAGPLAAWTQSIHTLRDRLRAEHALGRFAPTDALSPMSALTEAVGPDTPAITHVLLRCAHLLCNRLDIHGAAEARITSLLARTLVDLAPAQESTR